ncbi:MAG: GTP cyclohydrolase I [Myxococcota bacterium]
MTPEEHFAAALEALGFTGDPEMTRTPAAFLGMLSEFKPLPDIPPVTPLPTQSTDPVVLRTMPYHSMCAHHLLPFFGHCAIVYRPAGRIAGFGWFPRLLNHFARRPQLEERLAAQLADAIHDALAPRGVGVWLSARQMCVEMRGARSPGVFEVEAWRGDDAGLRALLYRPGAPLSPG